MTLAFTLTGAPRTKKNSSRLVKHRGRLIPIPSKAWMKWASEALIELPEMAPAGLVRFRPGRTIFVPVNCRALFFCDTARSVDPVGLYQGLADLLEKRGVIENDSLIASWDGSRVAVDRKNPRTEVVLETVAS